MPSDDYPETVAEVLDDAITFRPEVLRALRAFKKSKPWSGSVERRKGKFRRLNAALANIYRSPEPELIFGVIDGSSSGASHHCQASNEIVLSGTLSVVTYLHEFAHATRGMGERAACRWSINLFRKVFPRQYARLVPKGHMLVRPADLSV